MTLKSLEMTIVPTGLRRLNVQCARPFPETI